MTRSRSGTSSRSGGRRPALVAALLAVLLLPLALAGCVGVPTDGPVVEGRPAGDPVAPPNPELDAESVDLDTLLRESDFVSLHTPLLPETIGMMNAEAFAKMKPEAVLVNTSRGPVVDMDALYHALKDGEIFAAALDVTTPEPIPMDSPLLELDNLIIVPHIASASKVTREKMSIMAAENLIAGLKGERLPTCVNPEVYE